MSLIDGDHHNVFKEFSELIQIHQASIVDRIHAHEPTNRFTSDAWTGDGSNGLTRVIQDGSVVDKGAVSTSYIHSGVLSPARAKTMKARGVSVPNDGRYNAAALSLVLHTRNPHVPTFRSDVRMFQVLDSSGSVIDTWLGGGADLTPYVLYDSDVSAFHAQLRSLCEEWSMDYGGMKKHCDEYFYIPCRQEHRGVGGIFFDDLPADGRGMGFVDGLVKGWMDVWLDGIREKDWQLIRRGRYLEFNLLYDRGVAFGLMKENPRTEGILVSAPPEIKWRYNHEIEKGGNEERLMEVLKAPRDWV
ncbi:hypothetical protein TrRE_jg8960 [Triparma retinervis]|uniref:Coproporphyrinogen oxidase n=1 Tax=Triparma retinervis TaxID=2557542 RepID=A0A9W7E9W3_9STRA|nr:hypothetical protein TrRE_jg8960 [Triparma retinervis]